MIPRGERRAKSKVLVEPLLHQPERVRLCIDALGFFGALSMESLEAVRLHIERGRCGGLVQGHRSKRLCRQADDPECWRARRAEDRKRSHGKSD